MNTAEEITEELVVWLQARATQALAEGGRERVREGLDSWLTFTARKKLVPDLDVRLNMFRKRIRALSENMMLELGAEGCVVKASGDSESTLRMLERGTDWFDPAANLTDMIVGAIWTNSS